MKKSIYFTEKEIQRMYAGVPISGETPIRTITIHEPYLVTEKGFTRVIAKIDVEDEKREVWFQVDEQYEKYLCYERSDAFLVGLLNWAMRERCDFLCEAPVTEELLYQLREYLIPAVTKASTNGILYAPKITASTTNKLLPNAGAVGTGISCGIDSLHVVAKHMETEYKNLQLTHLVINNVGSFGKNINKKVWQMENANSFCKEYGFNLIKTDSNFADAFPQKHTLTHTYSSTFSILMLQKLWEVYYYASSGYPLENFKIKNNECNTPDQYEIFALSNFSLRNLKIFSEGCTLTRFEKTKNLINFEPAQKYLNVCIPENKNCGKCGKCRRTLLALDALNAIDNFTKVFDVQYYKNNKNKYLLWLIEQEFSLYHDAMTSETYKILKKECSLLLYTKAFFIKLPYIFIRTELSKIKIIKKIYNFIKNK